LVLKNLYILTTNIAGLAIETGSTVDELRNNHLKLMRDVSSDILKLQSALTGKTFAKDALEKGRNAWVFTYGIRTKNQKNL
jgi:hypothetical protein